MKGRPGQNWKFLKIKSLAVNVFILRRKRFWKRSSRKAQRRASGRSERLLESKNNSRDHSLVEMYITGEYRHRGLMNPSNFDSRTGN